MPLAAEIAAYSAAVGLIVGVLAIVRDFNKRAEYRAKLELRMENAEKGAIEVAAQVAALAGNFNHFQLRVVEEYVHRDAMREFKEEIATDIRHLDKNITEQMSSLHARIDKLLTEVVRGRP